MYTCFLAISDCGCVLACLTLPLSLPSPSVSISLSLSLSPALPLYRHPSEHFCGTPAHHAPELLPTQHLWHSDSSQHQDFQKTSFDHDRVADEAVSSRKERDRLKRQSSPPAVIKDSCPMHLVATHSFISTYGVEDAIQFMVSLAQWLNIGFYI